MTVDKEYKTVNGVNYCTILSNTSKLTVHTVNSLMAIVKQDFPRIGEKSVSVIVYTQGYYTDRIGVQFSTKSNPPNDYKGY